MKTSFIRSFSAPIPSAIPTIYHVCLHHFFLRPLRFKMLTLVRNCCMPSIRYLKFPLANFQRGLSNGTGEGDASVRQTRLVKRVVAGILFGSTLGLAIYSKRAKSSRLMGYFEGCERLPKDHDYTSSTASDLYKYESFVFPSDIIKSGTLKQLETLELNQNDIIVASFPKSGLHC